MNNALLRYGTRSRNDDDAMTVISIARAESVQGLRYFEANLSYLSG